jgi:hypothetical protein
MKPLAVRIFKTAWFAKATKKSRVTDAELRGAIQEVLRGQADDLGGGVYKKRLSKNASRAIIILRHKHFCVYEYIFAKKDRDNIDQAELKAFRALAKVHALLTEPQIAMLLENDDWIEVRDES